MKYISTRGAAPSLGFVDVLLAGLASDGGLYVPAQWPTFTADELRSMRGKPYADVAFTVLKPFVGGEIADQALKAMIDAAYASFAHKAVVPLKQLDANQWLMELFHGPTLAFKDVAMQLLARLMDHALAASGRRATIVGATSGDTGGAAIEAFSNSTRTDVFILHPHGRVSDVQRRQMTTVGKPNVHNIALEGTFDDAQAHVKAMFADAAFRDRVLLSGVNSINWARIMAQTVYYFTSALSLGAPDRPVSFCVPTGNFGDIFAGQVARHMGLPVADLVIATNVNDILHRTLETGRYEVLGVAPTRSPSMDIQVSSNFERLLFEAAGNDAGEVRRLMDGLKQSGSFTLPEPMLTCIRAGFLSGRTDEAETATTISQTLAETGELLDPHTAVGYAVARRRASSGAPMVTLATAHPAKFPDAVEAASGVRPQLPPRLGDLMAREEVFDVLPNDLDQVKDYIGSRTRAGGAA
ncbi:MAG: threonine synthase [Anderseniella sp.]|jgi:threonine synthase|nr:threonine synthase [Anderseniella sp.]